MTSILHAQLFVDMANCSELLHTNLILVEWKMSEDKEIRTTQTLKSIKVCCKIMDKL